MEGPQVSEQVRVIKGHRRTEGGSLEPARMVVICMPSREPGFFSELGEPLAARRFKAAEGVEPVELFCPDAPDSSWPDFLPDEGECERIGMSLAPKSA